MRVLGITDLKDLKQVMQKMRVDHYGIEIMAPKGITHLVRINSLPNISANILKQQMLSLGGDAAVARDALTASKKKTDCLIIGTLSQLNRLSEKLNKQPFGLSKLAIDIHSALGNYQKNEFAIDLGRFKLSFQTGKTCIMGIVNLTPDSFSADGIYKDQRRILDYTQQLIKDGADIIDIGGESSRPGAKPVSSKEELSRVIPAIKILAKKIKVPISIDTYKPEVAKQALDNGAAIVNDITGLRNLRMTKIICRYRAGVIIMHLKGRPSTMQNNPTYKCLIEEIINYLDGSIKNAVCAGIDKEKIIIDPGIGFGKNLEHNLEILKRLKEFKVIGRPILVGPSRKSFIGKILNVAPQERIFGTISACILAVKNGASLIRAHDVKAVKQALSILDAINKN